MKKYVIIALIIVVFIIYVAVAPDWGNTNYEYQLIDYDASDWRDSVVLVALMVMEREGEMTIVSVETVGFNLEIVIEASIENGQKQIENIFNNADLQYRRIG